MRPIGELDCQDCGGRHEVHLTRSGELVAITACPASSHGRLSPLTRRQVEGQLDEARRELMAAENLFGAERVDYADLTQRLDEVHRHVVRVQNTLAGQQRR